MGTAQELREIQSDLDAAFAQVCSLFRSMHSLRQMLKNITRGVDYTDHVVEAVRLEDRVLATERRILFVRSFGHNAGEEPAWLLNGLHVYCSKLSSCVVTLAEFVTRAGKDYAGGDRLGFSDHQLLVRRFLRSRHVVSKMSHRIRWLDSCYELKSEAVSGSRKSPSEAKVKEAASHAPYSELQRDLGAALTSLGDIYDRFHAAEKNFSLEGKAEAYEEALQRVRITGSQIQEVGGRMLDGHFWVREGCCRWLYCCWCELHVAVLSLFELIYRTHETFVGGDEFGTSDWMVLTAQFNSSSSEARRNFQKLQ